MGSWMLAVSYPKNNSGNENNFVCPDCEEQVSYNDETCSNCGFSISSHKWKKTKIGEYAHFYDWDGVDARFYLEDIIKVEKYKKIKDENGEAFQLVETEYRSIDVRENGIADPIYGYILNVNNSANTEDGPVPDKECGWYTCSYSKKEGIYYCTINDLKFKSSNGSIVPVE
jgi:ribosomal protein L37E